MMDTIVEALEERAEDEDVPLGVRMPLADGIDWLVTGKSTKGFNVENEKKIVPTDEAAALLEKLRQNKIKKRAEDTKKLS